MIDFLLQQFDVFEAMGCLLGRVGGLKLFKFLLVRFDGLKGKGGLLSRFESD